MTRVVHLAAGHYSLCGLSNRDKPNARFADHIRDATCAACRRSLKRQRALTVRALQPWATEVAKHIQAPVYLVGSTLTSGVPRDTDVSAAIPDAVFAERWMPVPQWLDEGESGAWTNARYAWARECADVAKRGRQQTLREVDFQAVPESVHRARDITTDWDRAKMLGHPLRSCEAVK